MRRVVISVVATVLLGGCGMTFCERLQAANDRFYAGKPSCGYTEGATISVSPTGSKATCEANIGNCTADDQRTLNSYVDCLASAQACTAGNEKQATTAAIGCASKLISGSGSALSAACQQAFR